MVELDTLIFSIDIELETLIFSISKMRVRCGTAAQNFIMLQSYFQVREDDGFPKQICLTCLTKLDSFWDMHVLCKEAQIKIEKIFHSLRNQENVEQDNPTPTPEDVSCGVCNEEVGNDQMGVGCEGPCKKWFHCYCIEMNKAIYFHLVQNPQALWMCKDCRKTAPRPKIIHFSTPVEEKLRNLSESYPVSYGGSAVICLAPDPSPRPRPRPAPATITREAQVLPQAGPAESLMAPVTYLAQAQAPTPPAVAPMSMTKEPYPQTLIQVPQNPASEEPVVYQNCSVPAVAPAPPSVPRRRAPPVLVPKPITPSTSPAPATTTTTQRSTPTPLKRQNGDCQNGSDAKKLCIYCNKYFTDDIIDHHVSLHLRQSFSSCVECGKNFRSEEAMQRHRCDEKKDSATIDLDADDDEPIIV